MSPIIPGAGQGAVTDIKYSRLPYWFRQEIPSEPALSLAQQLSSGAVHTVCQSARCPNLSSCFKERVPAFMLLGDVCTRNCLFCGVRKTGDLMLDEDEPLRIALAVKRLGLKYAVITSVARDDLIDGGAGIFARTVELINATDRNIKVELLIPDFLGKIESLKVVITAAPSVLAHNIETVPRLYRQLRPRADYQRSLGVLRSAKGLNPDLISKSSIMLGLGEAQDEVIRAMQDLRDCSCDILTLGQYLAPSCEHYPVKEFISMEQFERYREIGLGLGFGAVLSGPLVRSSYRAQEIYIKSLWVK
jgi:lipoic acid synthetase